MKKIFLLLVLTMLGACNNPFDKYEESFNALEAAVSMGNEVTEIQSIIESITVNGNITVDNLTTEQISNMISSLETINENLDNPQVQAILTSYAEQYNVDLDTAVTEIQADLGNATLDDVDRDGDGNTTNEAAVLALVTSILGKI